jgi:U4/U6.U5 tri-snRNP-associated protein 3
MKMAKLRAENNAEERRLTDIQEGVATGSKSDDKTTNTTRAKESIVEIQEGELEDYEEDEQMQMLLGFSSGFASTKGQAVEDNHKSASKGTAAKNKARKYRQYMNRKGGFNRPLDAMK